MKKYLKTNILMKAKRKFKLEKFDVLLMMIKKKKLI